MYNDKIKNLILMVTEGCMHNFKVPSGSIWVRVIVLVTMGKQSQLPGLAWDGSLTKNLISCFSGMSSLVTNKDFRNLVLQQLLWC